MSDQFPPYHERNRGQYPHGQQPYGHDPYAYSPYDPRYRAPYPPPRRSSHRLSALLAVIALAALAGLGVMLFSARHGPLNQSRAWAPWSQQSQSPAQPLDPQGVAAKVDPGLVDINTVLGYQGGEAAGTGMVLTPDGEVLTNNHVVEGATRIQVTDVGNGQTYSASVVGYDRSEDVAVLKLQGASNLATVTTGDSSKVAVGDQVAGIGNAGGTGGTPSVAPGTVTALGQEITASDESSGSSEQLTGLIQVNANIQSGDSGGPLVNSAGQVIGMDTAASTGYQFGPRGSAHGTGRGAGFAIPINQALDIAKQIESGSASQNVHIGATAFLGVSVTDANEGASLAQVVTGGPAEQAGLARGDVITAINGRPIDSATTLTTLLDGQHPGDKITLTWLDPTGAQQSTQVTLAEGPIG
ncbi:S1C family serine protease [Amycolatopsis taiwanensis]|uniref:S1C family serine protease n=1 Tax=Amycolatopsis taiwanensis TaxID=342230 RepID=UPI0004BB466F|nr:trypsin-like peptidase domain-containing protein [Amycolatopsis taiwanensis]